MRHLSWQVLLGIFFVILAALLYLLHFFIFQDTHHIFIYMLGDFAFLPIEVLLVTLIIHRLLTEREKRTMLKKMNMVIGAFYSEVGTTLLKSLSEFDTDADRVRKDLLSVDIWSDREFQNVSLLLKDYDYGIDIHSGDLEGLQSFLVGTRAFMLGLLENPNLLEHDSFTDLLWAVFHLTEELSFREDVGQLPDSDYLHLAYDTKRAYSLLIAEWLDYMKHLKDEYPYLFSLAMRMNPFNPDASPVVNE